MNVFVVLMNGNTLSMEVDLEMSCSMFLDCLQDKDGILPWQFFVLFFGKGVSNLVLYRNDITLRDIGVSAEDKFHMVYQEFGSHYVEAKISLRIGEDDHQIVPKTLEDFENVALKCDRIRKKW